MKILYFTFFMIFLGMNSFAQFSQKWIKQVGSSAHERLFSIDVYQKSGIIAGGEHYKQGNRMAFPYVVRYDFDGNAMWQKSFPVERTASIKSVCSDNDGNIYAAGTIQDNKYDSYTDFFLVKISPAGDLLWKKPIRGAGYDQIHKVLFVPKTGNLIIAGYQDIKYYNEHHGVVMELDTAGNKIWRYVYSGSYGDEILDITQTQDGGYVFVGFEKADTNGEKMVLVGKVSAAGNEEWTQNIEMGSTALANSVTELEDGTLALCGVVREDAVPVHDVLLMRITRQGDEVWKKVIRQRNDEEASSLLLTNKGSLLTLAYSKDRRMDKTDIWLVETDLEGELLWESLLPSNTVDFGYELVESPTGEVAIGGSTYNHITHNWDGAIMFYETTKAPVVQMQSPQKTNSVTDKAEYQFEANVVSVDSMNAVQILLNGRSLEVDYKLKDSIPVDDKYTILLKADCLLNEGQNYIVVKAANEYGETVTPIHRLYYFKMPETTESK